MDQSYFWTDEEKVISIFAFKGPQKAQNNMGYKTVGEDLGYVPRQKKGKKKSYQGSSVCLTKTNSQSALQEC